MENPRVSPWRWEREGGNRPHREEEGVPAAAVRINDDYGSWKAWVYGRTHTRHGPLLWEMTHFVDVCNWFLASEPVEVCAMETGLYLHGAAIRYASGALATISMCANGSFGYPKELYEFMGETGVVAVHHMVEVITAGIEGAPRRTAYPPVNDPYPAIGAEGGFSGWLAKNDAACRDALASGDARRVLSVGPDKGHARLLEAFVAQIRGEGAPACDVDSALLATRACLAAVRSAKEHRFVPVMEA